MKQPKWLTKLSRKCQFPSELWDILAALRGPDRKHSSKLKFYTTSRIRSIIGIADGFNGLIVNDCSLNAVQLTARNKMLNTFVDSDNHFVMHFKNAMKLLKDIGYNVPDDELFNMRERIHYS